MANQKILIIDDDQDIRRLLDLRLRGSGYQTVFAADAITAMSVVRRELPDLIVLDIGLPGGDGVVVMDRLKAFPALAQIPVIVVSARDPFTTEARVLAAGAEAFVQKPVDNEQLLAAVRSALGEPADGIPARDGYAGAAGGR